MDVATRRRLHDELNIETSLEYVYKFAYRAAFADIGSECELCHVFLGKVPGDVKPNDHEIADIRYVTAGDLDREFVEQPATLTPWFKLEWQALTTDHRQQLAAYTGAGR